LKNRFVPWILLIFLVTSISLNIQQYKIIQGYKAQMDSINGYFKNYLRFLSSNIGKFDGSEDDLIIFSSLSGGVFFLSLACNVNGFYKNNLLDSDVFMELNNMFLNAPRWLEKIKENKFQLEEQLKILAENPNSKNAQEKLFELIKEIEKN